MAGYDDTYQMIISTLMGRPAGKEIQPDEQQAYEINMLNYIRSLELLANGPLIGIATPTTQPVQPNNARACYISGVAQDRTVTFQNFRNYLGQPIQITNGQMEACLVILIWDTQYWSAETVPTSIISAAENANFYYNYNVKKTYASVAAMDADKNNPIGTDGKYIQIGDIVSVVNPTTPSENGIYSYTGSGWTYQSSYNFQLVQDIGTDGNSAMSQNISTLLLGGAVRNDLYLPNKKSNRVQQAGLPWFVLDAYIDYTPVEGKYYVLSLFNKTKDENFYFALYERDIQTDEYQQKILFSKTKGVKLFNDVYLYTDGKTKLLVNWGVTPAAPWSMSVTQADGMQLNPKIFRPYVLNDATLVQENLSDFESYVNSWIDVNQLKIEIIGDNLHNPDTDTINKSLSDSGLTEINTPSYNLSDYIEVVSGQAYRNTASMRKVWDFPDKGVAASSMLENIAANTDYTPSGKYIRFIYNNSNTGDVVRFGKSDTDYNQPFSIKVFYMGNELLTEYSDTIVALNEKIVYKSSANLHNPDTDIAGKSLNNNGLGLVDSPNYILSDYIEVTPLIAYKSDQTLRKYWNYNTKTNSAIDYRESINANTNIIPNGKFVRFLYANSLSPDSVHFGKADEDIQQPYQETVPYTKDDLEILTPISAAILNIIKEITRVDEKLIYKQTANLHNPDTDTLGYSLQSGGNLIVNAMYNTVDFMTAEPLTEYKCNVSMRRVNCYNSAGVVILSVDSVTTITTPENTAKIRMMYVATNQPNAVYFGKSSDDIITPFGEYPYDKYERRIALYTDPVGGDNTHVLTIETADKILYTGSSSIESFYAPDFKAWVNKLQDFIDYMLVPYGWSGNGVNEIAAKLIANTPSPSANNVPPSEIKPTFVFIGQTLNSGDLIAEEFDTNYIQSNENLLIAAVSRTGAFPIIGTAYRTESRPWIENSLKKLADRWGAWFIPFGTYCSSMIRNNKFAGFYGNGHPAIRTHEAYTLPLLSYIERFPRPKQTLLIFEARNQSATVSELVYTNSMERAVLFRTIQVGERALGNDYQNMYDRLNESGYTIDKNNVSQYMQLLRKSNTQFGNIVLVEAIIPTVNPNSVLLEYDADNVLSVYIFDNLSKTFVLLNNDLIVNNRYIEFDRIKILFIGTGIIMRDIKFTINGGKDKPVQQLNRIMPVNTGLSLIESEGFTDSTISNWNIGTNTRFNMTSRFGDAVFNDMPKYLGESKDALILTDNLTRQFNINVESFGYKTLRIWTCSRLYPKIYNPEAYAAWTGTYENPYTNENWYDANKYDYDDMSIIVKYLGVSYSNQCKSINIQKVGLFWNLGYVDVTLPITREGSYELIISRKTFNNSYEMQICDVSMELLD